jgi:hypothetical protein
MGNFFLSFDAYLPYPVDRPSWKEKPGLSRIVGRREKAEVFAEGSLR